MMLHWNLSSETSTTAASCAPVPQTNEKDTETPRPKTSSLNTLLVQIKNKGKTVRTRLAIDSGSGVSLMNDSLVNQLGLKKFPSSLPMKGMFTTQGYSHFCVTASLCSIYTNYVHSPIVFAVVPDTPPTYPPATRTKILKHPAIQGLQLSDPELGGTT